MNERGPLYITGGGEYIEGRCRSIERRIRYRGLFAAACRLIVYDENVARVFPFPFLKERVRTKPGTLTPHFGYNFVLSPRTAIPGGRRSRSRFHSDNLNGHRKRTARGP